MLKSVFIMCVSCTIVFNGVRTAAYGWHYSVLLCCMYIVTCMWSIVYTLLRMYIKKCYRKKRTAQQRMQVTEAEAAERLRRAKLRATKSPKQAAQRRKITRIKTADSLGRIRRRAGGDV